jgi:opacity protein-like surface antigen
LDVHGMHGLKQSVKSAIAFSTNVAYDLSTSHRARPYVLGGVGMLRTRSRTSTYLARQSVADLTDAGWGINLGVGVRAFITPTLSLRPEVTYINALWNSTENLSETRASVAVGYHW